MGEPDHDQIEVVGQKCLNALYELTPGSMQSVVADTSRNVRLVKSILMLIQGV